MIYHVGVAVGADATMAGVGLVGVFKFKNSECVLTSAGSLDLDAFADVSDAVVAGLCDAAGCFTALLGCACGPLAIADATGFFNGLVITAEA